MRSLSIGLLVLMICVLALTGCTRKAPPIDPFAEVRPSLWPKGLVLPDSNLLGPVLLKLGEPGNNAPELIKAVSVDLEATQAALYDPYGDSLIELANAAQAPPVAFLAIRPGTPLLKPFIKAIRYNSMRLVPPEGPWPKAFDRSDQANMEPIRAFAMGILLEGRKVRKTRIANAQCIGALAYQMIRDASFLTEVQAGVELLGLALTEEHQAYLDAGDSVRAKQTDAALFNVLTAKQRLETQTNWLYKGNTEAAAERGSLYRQIMLRCAYLISIKEKPIWLREAGRPLVGVRILMSEQDKELVKEADAWLDSLQASGDPFVAGALPNWRKLTMAQLKEMNRQQNEGAVAEGVTP